jgi:hypothetical protein
MAQRGMILNQLAVRDSIRHGWDILRNNLGEIIILAVIFVLIGIVVGLASLFIALPLAAIFIVPIILAAIQGSAVITAATVIFAIIGVIIFILISAAVNSIIRTFQSATFTLAYHQWAGKSPKSVSAAL